MTKAHIFPPAICKGCGRELPPKKTTYCTGECRQAVKRGKGTR